MCFSSILDIGTKVDPREVPLLYVARAYGDNWCETFHYHGDEGVTLADLDKHLTEKGYNTDCYQVNVETPMHGAVYYKGNWDDAWIMYGVLTGFA